MNNSINSHSILNLCRLYLSIFLCLFLVLIQGISTGWTSPMLEKLNGTDDNPLGRPITSSESQLLGSIRIPGIILGAVLLAKLAKKFGRKLLISLLSFPSIIFFLLNVFAKEFWLIAASRFFDGLCNGGSVILIPIYICELSSPELRGRFCCCIALLQNIGMLVTYCVGPFVSYFWYHLGFSLLPICFYILFSKYGTESPYFSLLMGNYGEAENILKNLRGNEDVSTELERMKAGLQNRNISFCDIFKTQENRRALMIGVGLTIFMTLSGETVIVTYTQFIFDSAGGTWSADTNTIILGTAQVIFSFMAVGVTDRFGRKPHLAISYVILSFSLIIVGFYFFLRDQKVDMNSFTWLPLVGLIGYIFALYLGVQPLLHAVMGEIFPLKLKSPSIGFCSLCGAAVGFLMSYSFRSVQSIIGLGITFWIFAIFGILATIFVLNFMIETRDKTLEEVQEELRRRNKIKRNGPNDFS